MNPTPATDESPVPDLDPHAALRWWGHPRTQSPWLNEEIALRMAERLDCFLKPPTSWLHWEPLNGGLRAHAHLRARLPAHAVCHIGAVQQTLSLQATRQPFSPSWDPRQWRWRKTPLALAHEAKVQMIWANMALHLQTHPLSLLRRWHSQLQEHGFLMFSCLGPDTLRELRPIYRRMDWPTPHHPFTDMHDWGDMLVHSGFATPVMDMERLSLSYSCAQALLQDLRLIGRNLHSQRFPTLRGRAWLAHLHQAIDTELPRSADGRLILTVEVIYGHAFKPPPRSAPQPQTTFSMDDMRSLLRAKRGQESPHSSG